MADSDKLDLFKLNKLDYAAPKQPKLVTIAKAKYLAIEGDGPPGSEAFQTKVGALYAGAYTIKFSSKAAGRDFTVCKLEGIYWADGKPIGDHSNAPPDDLRWKLMIRVPDFIGKRDLKAAVDTIREKATNPEIDNLELEQIREGKCIQLLHVGPYEEERSSVERMTDFASEQGFEITGRHHEIYLSDPRRVEPARLRTILRLPVG